MAEKIKHHITGPRNAVMLFRSIAELMERNQEMKFPSVELGRGYQSDSVRFHVFGTGRGEEKRESIEAGFDTIIEHFGRDLEWRANDPSAGDSFSRDYFILGTVIDGVEVDILTERSSVGEMVEVADTGPQIQELGSGYLQAVRTSVTVWKPNITLTSLARPGFELEATPSLQAVEA